MQFYDFYRVSEFKHNFAYQHVVKISQYLDLLLSLVVTPLGKIQFHSSSYSLRPFFSSGFLIDIQNADIVKNIFFVQLTNFLSFLQMYVCEDCGHTTPEPEVHYLHLKDNHPFSPALHKFYDKRHFKFTNANFANMLLQVNS